jgi:peptidoglycan/xylan/chitin deacetylase (PgdA/CDA1 family)
VRGHLVRDVARAAARGAELAGLLRLLEARGGHGASGLRVLTYHRVAEPDAEPALHPGLVSATPRGFSAQMAHLARRWRVVSLAEVLAAFRAERALPARALLLTFDDAYLDFAENAWPVLARLGLPATLFVPTAYPDRPGRAFWWDRLYQAVTTTSRPRLQGDFGSLSLRQAPERARAFRCLRDWIKTLPHDAAMGEVDRICDALGRFVPPHRVLGWDALQRLAAEGVTLAPHTRTHPLLPRVSPERAREEALGSLEDLRCRVGPTPAVLAYPSGGHDEASVRAVAGAGFELAFTTQRGANRVPGADRLRLRRVPVTLALTRALLRTSLLPWLAPLAAPAPREVEARPA